MRLSGQQEPAVVSIFGKKSDETQTDHDNESDDERLDNRLKELGEAFLDEEVPDSLLDVLHRGFTGQPENGDEDGKDPGAT